MLSEQTMISIVESAQTFWNNEVRSPFFVELAQGKEVGHKIADRVDESTTSLLKTLHDTGFECDEKGKIRARSMGDIWVRENGIYHPVNVKASVNNQGGQPNLVSMNKVLDSLIKREIDAYYLLIIKIDMDQDPDNQVKVHMVDMLDHLDYVTFDAGPGQIMLKSDKFFGALRSGTTVEVPRISVPEKVKRLVELLNDGHQRLTRNRAQSLSETIKKVEDYNTSSDYAVTAQTQAALRVKKE